MESPEDTYNRPRRHNDDDSLDETDLEEYKNARGSNNPTQTTDPTLNIISTNQV